MSQPISTDLAQVLTERFDANAAAELDFVVGFAWPARAQQTPSPEVICIIHGGQLEIRSGGGPDAMRTDFNLYFRDPEHAIGLLSAQVNPIEAFMAGEFRSSGYLVWTFRMLEAFGRKP